MDFKVGDTLDYNPFGDEDEVIDSPAEFEVGEVLEINPFEGQDPYLNDPKSSDLDEPDEGGHSLWDIPRMMGRGAAGMAKTAGFVSKFSPQELATSAIGLIGDLTDNERLQAIRDYSDKHGASAKLTEWGETAESYYDEKLSPAMKASMKKTILKSADEEGVLKYFGSGIKDPWKIGGLIAESIPSTLLSMGGGALVTKNLIQTGLKSAPKIVQKVLGKMVAKYGVNKVAGVVGGAIGEGGFAGMENASQTYEEMMQTPQEELITSETYQEIFNSLPSSLSDEQKHGYARKVLAMAAAGFVGSTTAVTTGIFGAPSGAFMGKLIGGEGGKSLWGNLIKGAITEGLFEEAPQSGIERLVSNFSKRFLVDPNQPLTEGVGEAMASGGISGFAMGGGMAGIFRQAGKDVERSKAKDILTEGDETAEDILLGEDEAEKIRKKGKGKRFGGDESLEAEEEAGEHAEEDLEDLAEKEAPSDSTKRPKGEIPGKKPQGEKPEPTVKPGPGKKETPPSGVVQKPETDEGEPLKPQMGAQQEKRLSEKSRDELEGMAREYRNRLADAEKNLKPYIDGTYKDLDAAGKLVRDGYQGQVDGAKQALDAINYFIAKKGKLPPAPKGDRREGQRPGDTDRRAKPEREPPPWDAPFRALYTQAQKQPAEKWTGDAKLRIEAEDPMILDLAQRMGETIEADTDIDDLLKTIHGRIQAGMQPRKKTSEMTEDELRQALNTDYLTGLRNKQAFEIEDKRRKHVVSIDLDSLKYFNDNFGHQTGDAMLINFGNAMKKVLGKGIEGYHISGDEFYIQGDDEAQLEHILNKRIVEELGRDPIIVTLPDGKQIKYEVRFSYGTAKTLTKAEERLQEHKKAREAEGSRAGRGEIPPGLPGGVTKRKQDQDQRQGVSEKEIRGKTLKHFTTAERAAKIRKEGFKPQAEKPIFGMGGYEKGEKISTLAGDALYLAIDDSWSSVSRFKATGPAVPADGDIDTEDVDLFYDYDNQQWMAQPGKRTMEKLTPVEYDLAPDTKILTIGSREQLNKATAKYGFMGDQEAFGRIAKDYDAVLIANVDKNAKAHPNDKFWRSVMADQLIVLNRDKAILKGETPADTDDQEKIDKELEDLEHDPTEGQKKAGNYKKGHFKFMGFNVTIEEAPGDIRRGTAPDGTKWETKMQNAYGYFSRTEGKDGDEIDLFLGDAPETGSVFVVHQVDPKTGDFDEDKVMLGFWSRDDAKKAYMANYEKGWQGFGSMTAYSKVQFAEWLDKQTKERAAKKAAKQKPKEVELGQKRSVAGQEDMTYEAASETGGVLVQLWRPTTQGQKSVVRMVDTDAGETIEVTMFPSYVDALFNYLKKRNANIKADPPRREDDARTEATGILAGKITQAENKGFKFYFPEDAPRDMSRSDREELVGAVSGGYAERLILNKDVIPLLEKILPDEAIGGVKGKNTSIITPGNKRGYKGYYTLVEADDLIPSHNPQTFQKNEGYPEGIQERTYHSDTQEQGKVIANAKQLNPAIVLSDDPTPTNGPPIVTESGIVLGGNSRAMSIQRAYGAKKAAAKQAIKYKNQISLQAAKFGLKPNDAMQMQKPILVRTVFLEKNDTQTLHRMASEFNKSLTQGVSEEAETASMGKNISVETIEKLGLRMAERDLTIRELLGKKDGMEVLDWLIDDDVISPTDKNRFINRKVNLLNQTGKTLIEKALFGSIIDDADLIDAAPKSMQNKIGRALPSLARIKARGDQWDITPELKEALALATRAKGADLSIREFLKQKPLFGDEPSYSDVTRALAGHLDMDTQTVFANSFKKFAAYAMADAKQQTQMFPPTPFAQAFKEAFAAEVKERGEPMAPKPEPEPEPTGLFVPKTADEQLLMSPKDYVAYKQAAEREYRKDPTSDIHDEFEITYKEKVKVEETGEVIEREIDAVAYLNDIEDEIGLYESLLNCMAGRSK